MKKTILLRFFGQEHQIKDALQGKHALAAHWSGFWPYLIENLGHRNYQLLLDDKTSSYNVDYLWIIDIPPKKQKLDEVLRRVNADFILYQQIESPLSHPAALNPKNLLWADAVISYDPIFLSEALSSGIKSGLNLRVSLGLHNSPLYNLSFHERKTLTLVNTNIYYGLLKPRQAATHIFDTLPVLNWYRSGYKIRNNDVVNLLLSERYSLRRKICRQIEHNCHKTIENNSFVFDIYGANWSGEAITWLHKVFKPQNYSSNKGQSNLDKLELLSGYRYTLAIENYQGRRGYISEKIIDPLLAGSVPIYLGDFNIKNYIPENCFISISSFSSTRKLLQHLVSITEEEWMEYKSAGDSFLSSGKARIFDAQFTANKLADYISNLSLT